MYFVLYRMSFCILCSQVPEVRSLLFRALELLAGLKLSLRQLATVPTDDATGWTDIMQKIDSDKVCCGDQV